MQELEAERARREKTNKQDVAKQKEPRASTTDAQARVMKMADGGFRPAYNMQIVADPKSQVIVAVDIDTSGSDRGLARPAIEALHARDYRPSNYLVDGGFTKKDDIEWAHAAGTHCGARRERPSTAPIRMRRGPTTVRPWRIGASAWRAILAKKSIDAEPSTSASMPMPGARGSSSSRSVAKTRSVQFCCGSRSPTTCSAASHCAQPPSFRHNNG
jgi:hypothetical protein